ncbi:MAG TPA: hypothetical protein VG737_02100, partial [Cyclobacteriaceae bacterium]|nr:hypothetical protein [Cyclobacteriaceae bacterium]
MRNVVIVLLVAVNASGQTMSTMVNAPASEKLNSFYTTNQPPLLGQRFVKLPVGAVRPGGWLLKSLELERDGLAGNLGEIS